MYGMCRDKEAVACFRRREEMVTDDKYVMEMTCALAWSGEIASAWRTLNKLPVDMLTAERTVVCIALGMKLDRHQEEVVRCCFSEQMYGRMAGLCVRLAQLGQIERALRVANALWDAVKSEESLYANIFPRVLRSGLEDCLQVIHLCSSIPDLSLRVRYCLAKALYGSGRVLDALKYIEHCLLEVNAENVRYYALRGEILDALGRHIESAQSFQRCSSGSPEYLSRAIQQRLRARQIDEAFALFRDCFCPLVPASLQAPNSEQQYALNTTLRKLMQWFEDFFCPLAYALVPSHLDAALDLCALWTRVTTHLKWEMDGDCVIALCFVILHGNDSLVAIARTHLQDRVQRAQRARKETYAEYLRRLHREKQGITGEGELLVEARSLHELQLFNLLAWLEARQGNMKEAKMAQSIVLAGATLLHLDHVSCLDYLVDTLDSSHGKLASNSF